MQPLQITKNKSEIQLREDLPAYLQLSDFDMANLVNAYRPISLREMDSVKLLDRTDTKYVLSGAQVYKALQELIYSYQVLEIHQERIHHYRTLYYDTNSFDLYHRHVTGRSDIFKVRSREYLDTQLFFLEVKHKNQKKRTKKSRLCIPYQAERLSDDYDSFLQVHNPFTSRELEPKLWNVFKRITLVSKRNLERLTIDIDLNFFTDSGNLKLDGIAVAEVKQDQYAQSSAFMLQMRRMGIRPTGFSKYCYGVSQLYPGTKNNTQKKNSLLIHKLQHGGSINVCFS